MSAAVCVRRLGDFSRAPRITPSSSRGTAEFACDGGATAVLKILSKTTAGVGPLNGDRPVAISYSTTPHENKSLLASTISPRACSGDMYPMVPSAVPGIV